MPDLLDEALFQFEDVLPDLEFVPLAARRALDIAGVRLTLEGWRSLSMTERRALISAGAPEDVDVEEVLGGVRRAAPPATRIAPTPDPDPYEPPEAIARALGSGRCLDGRSWANLRSLDRFAIVHGYRRAVAKGTPTQLEVTYDAIIGPNTPSRPIDLLTPYTPARAIPAMSPAAIRKAATPLTPAQASGNLPTPVSSPVSPQKRSPSSDPNPRAQGYQAPGAYSISTPPPPRPGGNPRAPVTPVDSRPLTPRMGTHVTERGEVHMVAVSEKAKTVRRAVARGSVRMRRETAELVAQGEAPKGEVLASARIAGILAAKRTPELVPLCHHVALTRVAIELEVDVAQGRIEVIAMTEAVDRTGVEMEAMVAVSVACLTLYDMLKSVDREMEIVNVQLVEKIGGKTGHWVRGS